jgi:hypothetical protein
MREIRYYHGTSDEKDALSIIKEGIRPDLSENEGLFRPVEGRIYLTANLENAIPYMLGGSMAGHELPEDWIKKSRYCYLFVIDGKNLGDIQPDEDQIGQAIHDKAFSWVSDYFELLEEELCVEDDEQSLYSNLLAQIDSGEYSAWVKAGHVLLKHLTEKEKYDIIIKYGNVANKGGVFPTEAWKFDKLKSIDLLADGYNLFELAEKIEF